jgi:fucose permease
LNFSAFLTFLYYTVLIVTLPAMKQISSAYEQNIVWEAIPVKFSKIFLILTCFVSIFGMALSTGIRGILVPNLISSFNVTGGQISTLFSASTFFSIFAIYLGGQWCERYGQKKVILVAQILSGILYFLVAQISDFTLFVIGYSAITFSVSVLIISINTIATIIPVRYPAILVNLIHFFFGLGLTVSQRVAGLWVANGADWIRIFNIIGMIFLFTAIFTFFMKEPHVELRVAKVRLKELNHLGYLAVIAIGIGFYVASEIQTGNLIILYLKELYAFAEDQAGTISALFFGMFTIGRLLGGLIAEKLGYSRSVMLFTVSASILYVSGMLLGQSGIYLIAASGFFYSLIFPTITLILAREYGSLRATAIAIVSTAANLMTLISSLMIGGLTDTYGIAAAYWVIPVFIVLSAVSFIVAFTRMRKIVQ